MHRRTQRAGYLFGRTSGHIGSFVTPITRGCYKAICSGEDKLTTGLLDGVRIDEASEKARSQLAAAFKAARLSAISALRKPSPKFPPGMERGRAAARGNAGELVLPDYAYPSRWLTPRSSKAWRWRGVGVVMTVKAGSPPAGWMWLAVMVARSAGRVARLCTGPPSAAQTCHRAGAAAGAWARLTSRHSSLTVMARCGGGQGLISWNGGQTFVPHISICPHTNMSSVSSTKPEGDMASARR